MTRRRAWPWHLLLVLLALAAPASAWPAVLVEGRIVDPTGAAVPGAEVFVRRPEVGFERAMLSDDQGRFRVELVVAGRYLLTARAPGFAVEEREFDAAGGSVLEVTLKLGGLSEVVTVAASHIAGSTESARWIPGSVDVVDSLTIASGRAFTFGEVLRKVPGIHVKDEEGFGLRPSIGLRGLDPNRSAKVLLLEDGIPLGHAPYGDTDAYYHPPIERYASLEVVKGSAQIAYGPMTIGGVLNYITPRPPDHPTAAISVTGGSRDYINTLAQVGFRVGRVGLLMDAMRKVGDGARDNIHSRLSDVNVKAVVDYGAGRSLTLKANYYGERSQVTYSGLTSAEFAANPRANQFANDAFRGDRTGVSASYLQAFGARALFSAAGYLSTFGRDWWRQSSNSDQRPNDSNDPACGGMANLNATCGNEGRLRDYRSGGIDPRVRIASRLFGLDHETDIGLRAHWETQDRIQRNGPLPTSRDGVLVEDQLRTNTAYSGYLQHRVLAGRWAVTPGFRVEHIDIGRTNRLVSTGGSPAQGETSMTVAIPGLGLSFSPGPSTTVFGGVHRGFAPPRPSDIVSITGGVLELDPELSWNYELGVRALVAPGVRVAATLFRLDYENQIVPANLSGGVGSTLTSAGQTFHQGVELSGRLDLGTLLARVANVYVTGTYTFLPTAEYRGERYSAVAGSSTILITGHRLPYAPRQTFSTSLGFAHPRGFDGQIEAVHVGDQFGDDLNTIAPTPNGQRGLLPGFTTWNATAGWQLGRTPSVSLFVSVKNLLDDTPIVDRRRGVMVGMPRLVHVGTRVRF